MLNRLSVVQLPDTAGLSASQKVNHLSGIAQVETSENRFGTGA